MPDQPRIPIRLGKQHREVLLEKRLFIYSSLCQIICDTPIRQPVKLTRSDWDHIQGCIASKAQSYRRQAVGTQAGSGFSEDRGRLLFSRPVGIMGNGCELG